LIIFAVFRKIFMRKNLKALQKSSKLYLTLKHKKLSHLLMNKRKNLRLRKKSLLYPLNLMRKKKKKKKRNPNLLRKQMSQSLELPRKPPHLVLLLLKSPLIKNLQLRNNLLLKLRKI